jgi:ribosomal protein L13E
MSKFLASPDVAVTNKKDKVTMLPIVGKTDEHVREMMSGMHSVIPESREGELREDDSPIARFIDSARDKAASLFGVNPSSVVEREGVPGNPSAFEPSPQPPASPAKPPPQPTPLRFNLNERVECHDWWSPWQVGTVVSAQPLMVQPDGDTWVEGSMLVEGFTWDEVRVLSPGAAEKELNKRAQEPAEILSYCLGQCLRMYVKRKEKERAEAAARAEEAVLIALASSLTMKQLRAKGYAQGLKAAGITCAEAKTAGYTVEEVKRAGYNAREAKAVGFDIKAAGYTSVEIKAASFTCAEAQAAG